MISRPRARDFSYGSSCGPYNAESGRIGGTILLMRHEQFKCLSGSYQLVIASFG